MHCDPVVRPRVTVVSCPYIRRARIHISRSAPSRYGRRQNRIPYRLPQGRNSSDVHMIF